MTKFKCIEDLDGKCMFIEMNLACEFDLKCGIGPTQCPYGRYEINHHNNTLYPLVRQIRCEVIE